MQWEERDDEYQLPEFFRVHEFSEFTEHWNPTDVIRPGHSAEAIEALCTSNVMCRPLGFDIEFSERIFPCNYGSPMTTLLD